MVKEFLLVKIYQKVVFGGYVMMKLKELRWMEFKAFLILFGIRILLKNLLRSINHKK
jgi:hypothetical protein